MPRLISGPEFKRAVRRSGLSNQAAADLIGIKLTMLNEYMKDGVRPIRVERVLREFGPYLEDGNPLVGFSNLALIAELARRLDDTDIKGEDSASDASGDGSSGKHEESNGGSGSYTGSGLPPE